MKKFDMVSVVGGLALMLASASALAAPRKAQSSRYRNPRAVPELDGKVWGAGAVLLVGGVLVLSERRRRRNAIDPQGV